MLLFFYHIKTHNLFQNRILVNSQCPVFYAWIESCYTFQYLVIGYNYVTCPIQTMESINVPDSYDPEPDDFTG